MLKLVPLSKRVVLDGIHRGLAGALFCCVVASTGLAHADYPIASHRYLADPGSLVSGGRVYLYNSNDDDNPVAGGYEMKSIVCVSSSDLKNWTDHGEVLRVPASVSWAGDSWAPAAVERNGKVYLYFGNNGNGVGVASSDSPTGPFKDAKGSALVDSGTPGASGTNIWLFDPSIFVDTDGQAYLTFGGNGDNNARVIKVNNDMVSVSGSAIALTVKDFFEASWLFKRKNLYYFTYSTNTAAGLRIDYLTSSSPTSGYTYRGVVGDQPPSNGNNNHHSDFEFNGNWYHAYHNRLVATQAGISTTYRRNLGLERLDFADDGAIQQVAYTTDGVKQLGSLNPYQRVEAETTNAQSGIETEPCSEGGMDVTSLENGDYIKVRGVDFGGGAKSFSARVAAAANGGKIELHLDSTSGALIGSCSVPVTGGAQTWSTVTCDVSGAAGVKDLYLKFSGGSSQLFSVNYWQFSSIDGSTGAAGAAGMAGAASSAGGASATGGLGGVAAGAAAGAGDSSPAGNGTGGTLSGNAGSAAAGAGGTKAESGAPGAGGASGSRAGEGGSPAQEGAGCGCFVASRSNGAGTPATFFVASLFGLGLRGRQRRRRARITS